MATMLNAPTETQRAEQQQRVVLHNVSWSLYEHLLAEHVDVPNPRFAYDRGTLEIMVNSFEHEHLNRLIADIFSAVADELDLDFVHAGSTTFRREDLERGFEPDTSFYIANAARVAGKKRIDLRVDPPPDLVIEIDITSPSLSKFPIFAALRIPEVWRYDGYALSIFNLEHEDYVVGSESRVLPGLTREQLIQFIESSKTGRRTTWLRNVREWAQESRRGG